MSAFQSSLLNVAALRRDSAHASPPPQRRSASGAYASGSKSPKTSNFSSGVRLMPIFCASMARSTAAAIFRSRSIRPVNSVC